MGAYFSPLIIFRILLHAFEQFWLIHLISHLYYLFDTAKVANYLL